MKLLIYITPQKQFESLSQNLQTHYIMDTYWRTHAYEGTAHKAEAREYTYNTLSPLYVQ